MNFWNRVLCFCSLSISCCALAGTNATPTDGQSLEFAVFWPPRDPSLASAPGARPLLNGRVNVRLVHMAHSNSAACVRIALTRPSNEAARTFWNSRLAFPEYDWMRYVRVWDDDRQWLWPNLPYLLRLHGRERVERYGGVDPGKGVDNDFAAVLIRTFDASGSREDEVTKKAPLVSAEWHPVGVTTADKQTIVHTAESDEFTLHIPSRGDAARGLAAVWLIYADFMEARLPSDWPKAPEFAGGVLAYFEVEWNLHPPTGHPITIRNLVPKRSTGFDWAQWVRRTLAVKDSKSTAKLSNATPVLTNH